MDYLNLSQLQHTEITTNKKVTYINIESALDIETTSTMVKGEKMAYMYAWAFGIKDENHMVYGREWSQFVQLMTHVSKHFNLGKDRRLVVYVQNLGFEFQHMRKYFGWEKVFSAKDRKPIIAISKIGIEFRDSYVLSSRSLESMAENLANHKIEKLVGHLDYSRVRHQNTKLTEREVQYLMNDVLIVLYYINEQIEYYSDISKVPLTNTQRVRRYVRDGCYYTHKSHKKSNSGKYIRYRNIMKTLQLSEEVYDMSKRAFMGGYVHASPNNTDKVFTDVESWDLISSYPAVMVTEKFPMSSGTKTELTEDKNFDYYRKRFCLLFDVRFTGLVSKNNYENYLSESKAMRITKPIINNGRVFSAEEYVTTMTDVDFNIVEQCYTWETMQVANVYRFERGYLPKDLIKSIISLYNKKTKLKGMAGRELDYVINKEMLNSVFGMMVTDVVKTSPVYEDEEDSWETEQADATTQIERYNNQANRFLFYPWGVWVTAYARRNVWYAITYLGKDYLYSDTDAVKYRNPKEHTKFFTQYNNMIEKKLQRMCDTLIMDIEDFRPKNEKGEAKLIGTWEQDGEYSKFKTLGAKQYLVEHKAGGLGMTLAGLDKQKGIAYLQEISATTEEMFERFDAGFTIPANKSGKISHTYIDDPKSAYITDYQGNTALVNTLSGIYLEDSEFTLSSTRKYLSLVENMKDGYFYLGQMAM